jgi:hypothetical protein
MLRVFLCWMIVFEPGRFDSTSDQDRLTVLTRCFIDGALNASSVYLEYTGSQLGEALSELLVRIRSGRNNRVENLHHCTDSRGPEKAAVEPPYLALNEKGGHFWSLN